MKKRYFTKVIANLVLLFLITLAVTTINAQSINKENSTSPDYFIEYFKVTELNNVLYFNFLIIENNNNIGYVLESSVNESEFQSIQIKQGVKSPNRVPLLYCYSEKLMNNENTTYRIKRISADGNINYSFPITINNSSRSEILISCVAAENSTLLFDRKEGKSL